jgi:hypothetical protein
MENEFAPDITPDLTSGVSSPVTTTKMAVVENAIISTAVTFAMLAAANLALSAGRRWMANRASKKQDPPKSNEK